MKKRICALLAALTLLALSVPVSSAGETVYFTAVSDRVLELKSSTMPFWYDGYLYIAATAFREAGLGYAYNSYRQTLVLYQPNRHLNTSLTFDIVNSTAVDRQGVQQAYCVPVMRNGEVFLPAAPVASYFGMTYSNVKVPHGYLVWVAPAGNSLSGTTFADLAAPQMESRYQQFQKSFAPEEEPETEQPVVVPVGKSVYLCFAAGDPQTMELWLNTLDAKNAHATFYFTAETLLRSGDLLRRLVATSHGVGLILEAGSGSAADRLENMERTLFSAAGVRTRLIRVEDDSAELSELERRGYRILDPRIDRGAYGLSASGADPLLRSISNRSGAVSVWLGGSVSASGLREFLSDGSANRMYAMTETVD